MISNNDIFVILSEEEMTLLIKYKEKYMQTVPLQKLKEFVKDDLFRETLNLINNMKNIITLANED